MKNSLLKFYIAGFYLCSTFVMLADPGDDTGGGDLEGDGDSSPLPIDDYIWVVALIALFFVFMKFRAIQKQNKSINS